MSFEDFLMNREKIRISDLKRAKQIEEKWAMLTSYDATSAKIFDLAKIPVLLVGDSASQAVFGHKSTIPITMDEMIPIARAVSSSCQRALVIADMPFGSYQESPQLALRNATRFMKEAGAHGVKLEGGASFVEHVRLLSSSGIPVMAHVGLTPQAEHALSGYKVQGRKISEKTKILDDARALEKAGAFACVVELVPSDVGQLLSSEMEIPVVGIGAGPHTDAQVLVWTDMVGFSPPKGTSVTYLSDAENGQAGPSPKKGAIKAETVSHGRAADWGPAVTDEWRTSRQDDWGTSAHDGWTVPKVDEWVPAVSSRDDRHERTNKSESSITEQRPCNVCRGRECGGHGCKAKLDLGNAPKFVKRYANMSDILFNAAKEFYDDVVSGDYPAPEHCYK